MNKSRLVKIESNKDFYVCFGSRRSGKSYYELKKLQENYNILKKTNDGLIYTQNCLEMEKSCLQQRINKVIDIIEEVLFIDVKDYRSQLEIIEDILKGSEK